jgi:type IV pilus assembly protein PilY1
MNSTAMNSPEARMNSLARYYTRATQTLCGAVLALLVAPTQATIPVGSTPLFLTVTVPPNIIVTLDDSGSMARAYVPELCGDSSSDCSALDSRNAKSAYYNPMYYDPTVTYPLPKNAVSANLTTTFTGAWRNGFDQTTATTKQDLSIAYHPTAYMDLDPTNQTLTEGFMSHQYGSTASLRDVQCRTTLPRVCMIRKDHLGNTVSSFLAPTTGTTACTGSSQCVDAPLPAYYYTYVTACGDKTNQACYVIHVVTSNSGPGGTDERQNFANWYSFARTRNLTTATSTSLAFSDLPPTVRVAWQGLNTCHGDTTNFVDTDCDGWKNNFTGVSNAIKEFSGTHRSDFFNWVFQQPTNNTTPLPVAMKRAGEYYRTSGENSPYDNDFTTSNSGELSCRRNYHLMMTDGMWNVSSTVAKSDGAQTTLPEPTSGPGYNITAYTSNPQIHPYYDNTADTLADVAFHYWVTDLRTTLQDNLAAIYRDPAGTPTQQYWNPRNDPASWQHMVNFTIGLGISSYFSDPTVGLTWTGNMYTGSYASLASGATAWPAAGANNIANSADLWHAALNSRGQFYSADNPAAMAAAFQNALVAITGDSGASAALSTNSTSLQAGFTRVYQAKFDRGWSGGLLSFQVGASGVVSATPDWDARSLIPAANVRKIYTFNDTSHAGVDFTSAACATANFTASMQATLNKNTANVVDNYCAQRVNWLRGSATDEVRNAAVGGSLGIFRNRTTTVMGDIINSDPGYVKNVDYGYSSLPTTTPGQSTYANYVATNGVTGSPDTARMPMIYVGANDGRMYGIRADFGTANSGVEQFAFIPRGVFDNLTYLTDPAYSHRYYVDGAITVGDAYIARAPAVTPSWKSVVVAGLNAGGKSVYALDVTDPSTFNASNVMWEFTDVDLGYTFSQPQIGILQSGQWVAIFGNGYNSRGGLLGGGGAYLYVVDLATGTLIKKIKASDTGTYIAANCDTTQTALCDESNGLSTPLLVDTNNDKLIDTVYAGDLSGNMWKFDLSSLSSATWGVAYGGIPLFKARDAGGQKQAITAKPVIYDHPLGGRMVYFGTGRYMDITDVYDLSVQSFYGIYDNGTAIISAGRTQLQSQAFSLQQAAGVGRTSRSVSNNSVNYPTQRGWYIDLKDPPAPGVARGERAISAPLILYGSRVLFVSVIPSIDQCKPGGDSWLIELDYLTGGAFAASVLDANGDGIVNSADDLLAQNGTKEVAAAVNISSLGISKTPVVLTELPTATNPNDQHKLMTGTGGTVESITNGCGTTSTCVVPPPPGVIRRYWIQIR